MPIPESQLDTWSRQGSVAGSRDTYAVVRAALEATSAPYADKGHSVFLQGSYSNDTNVYGESDVDVVISLASTFYYDLASLPPDQQKAFHAAYPPATHPYSEFRQQVLEHLQQAFPGAVTVGGKAVKIAAGGSRRNTDVLISADFRLYGQFLNFGKESFDEGVCFFNAAGRRIVNYPQLHAENCTAKHKATNSWFKPMVRVIKNLRSRLVDDGAVPLGLAPSYYLEGLFYNVPNDRFGGSFRSSFVNAMEWLRSVDRSEFVCANERYYLLREDPDLTWAPAKCADFLARAQALWDGW